MPRLQPILLPPTLLLFLACSTPKTSPAPAAPDADCVSKCERRNMARAVSAEMIRAECEKECADPPAP